MNRIIRFGIAALLLLSIVLLARSQAAGAIPAPQPSLAIDAQEGQPVNVDLAKDDDCEKDKNGKVKDKCKGTVKPPNRDILIPVTGDYSIGGFCTVSAQFEDPDVTLDGGIVTPLPRELPDRVHKVRQGCLLTYQSSNQFMSELPPDSGSVLICFAATPEKQMTVYFYDYYGANPTWTSLGTTVQAGIACAPANESGVYVATFMNP